MTKVTTQNVELLRNSGVFDADWYCSAYSDVRALRMDPAEHYLKYGIPMGRMATDGLRIDIPVLEKLQGLATPPEDRALLEAHKICQSDGNALGLAYAYKYLPKDLGHSLCTLRANEALRRKDEASWLNHLNDYLGHFNLAHVALGEGKMMFDRFKTAPLQCVTGGPLISIIMTTWNAERTVRMAMRSILVQTWRNLELLIIDDCSEDGTWAIIKEIAAQDTRVRIMRNKVNVGPYVSKNIALLRAKGEWITSHDADDWAHPQRLERHFSNTSGSRASMTNMLRMKEDGCVESFSKIGNYSNDGVGRLSFVSCLFKKEVLDEYLGFWDSVRFGADSEMISRAKAFLGSEFFEIQEIGMLCLDLENSLTNHPENGIKTSIGLSEVRRNYKVQWEKKYTGLNQDSYWIPLLQMNRHYKTTAQHAVDINDIKENLQHNRYVLAQFDNIAPDLLDKEISVKKINHALPKNLSLAASRKILCIFHEHIICKRLEETAAVSFERDFFNSETWPNRPNSTSRLSLVNYQALSELSKNQGFNISFLTDCEGSIDWSKIINEYDTIIINQVANKKSMLALKSLASFLISTNFRHNDKNIILGTEGSLFSEMRKGTFSKDEIDLFYKKCTVLRHTARTDAPLYFSEECLTANVLEFEIGIDTNVVAPLKDFSEKKNILFVAAPSGRVTKNNDRISVIKKKLIAAGVSDSIIKIIEPPYSTEEYWSILEETLFLIFTSDGETFSYVLNDAKSMGAISFYPQHMYWTFVGNRFCIDAYPELSHKYVNSDDVVEQVTKMLENKDITKKLSAKSRDEVVKKFGLSKITENWRALLSGEALTAFHLLVIDSSVTLNANDLTRLCETSKADYVISLGNKIDIFDDNGFSIKVPGVNTYLIRHCFNLNGSGYNYALSKNKFLNPFCDTNTREVPSPIDVEIPFWDMVLRSYKIAKISIYSNYKSPPLLEGLDFVASSRGVCIELLSKAEGGSYLSGANSLNVRCEE